MKISSATNPRIKQIVKFKDRKDRREKGLTIVEGIREIAVARQSAIIFKEYYVCPEILSRYVKKDFFSEINAQKIPVYEIPKEIFSKISFGDRQEGIVAVVEPKPWRLNDIKVAPQNVFVVVENVEKPGNLGAILRTCDAAGVAALLIADTSTDIYNPNVIRASLGTVFSLSVVQASAAEILSFLKQKRIRIVAASPQAKMDYTQVRFKWPLAFVVGNEHEGLSDLWLKAADDQMRIPMQGKADSLNVSVSAAVLVYEAMRQLRD